MQPQLRWNWKITHLDCTRLSNNIYTSLTLTKCEAFSYVFKHGYVTRTLSQLSSGISFNSSANSSLSFDLILGKDSFSFFFSFYCEEIALALKFSSQHIIGMSYPTCQDSRSRSWPRAKPLPWLRQSLQFLKCQESRIILEC